MKARWTGIAMIVAIISAGWTLTFGQAAPQQAPPAAGAAGAAPQRGGGGGGAGAGGGGQRGNRGGGTAAPAQPAPRWPDGTMMLGPGPNNQMGLWHGDFGISGSNIPYQPWAKAMAIHRNTDKLEPHARCHASGAVRQFQTPYGVDIVELKDAKRVLIFDVGGPHTFRTIYMDGRAHPKDLTPTAYGHSIGKWDGDTFVIDTVGYSESFWVDRGDTANSGFVATDKLHTIEKLTRIAFDKMRYELTIDDPGAYTAIWTANAYSLTLRPAEELFEYVCQDNNQGPELMVGTMESVDRRTLIVP